MNNIINEEKNKQFVLSTRIRLARNLSKIAFPNKLSEIEGRQLVSIINSAFYTSKYAKEEYKTINLWDNDDILNRQYFERHLISKNCINNGVKSAFILNKDETVSIMINEEDHLRIQCINSGFNLEKTYEIANNLDDLLEEKLDYSFDEKLGYLTACPTNLGTGLRASVMMHLPALSMNNEMGVIFNALSQVGMTIRGLYGEGSDIRGNLYQISNQITLGLSEEEIINNLKAVITQLITRENIARDKTLRNYKYELRDRVFRSLGVLKFAVILSGSESLKFLSDVRLGVEVGIIKNIGNVELNSLLVEVQTATLQKSSEEKLDEKQLNLKRAKLVRQRLNDVNFE